MAVRTILLIEDNEAALHIFSTVLQFSGYEVLQARSGSEGFRILEARLPDAVVVDIGLPVLDGFEVLERLRSQTRTRDLPVVVATVHVFPADEARARALGCDVFLRKPVEPLKLVAALDDLLATRSRPGSSAGG